MSLIDNVTYHVEQSAYELKGHYYCLASIELERPLTKMLVQLQDCILGQAIRASAWATTSEIQALYN